MNPSHNPHDPLERLIDGVLRAQPPLPAPDTLRSRVLAEIELRTQSPWWRRGFAYWPAIARAAFILVCLGAIKFSLDALAWAGANLSASKVEKSVAEPLVWMQTVNSLIRAMAEAGVAIFNVIPLHWLAIGMGIAAALYAALFGIGTAAYRTLSK